MKELIPSTQVPPLKQELEADETEKSEEYPKVLARRNNSMPTWLQYPNHERRFYSVVVEKKNQGQSENTVGNTSHIRLETDI